MTRHRRLILCVALLAVLPAGGSRLLAQGGGQALEFDSGLLHLTPNQGLVMTAVNAGDRRAQVTVGFMVYTVDVCPPSVACLHEDYTIDLTQQRLSPNSALSIIWNPVDGGVRARVRVTGRNPVVKVRFGIRDTSTGQIYDWIEGV